MDNPRPTVISDTSPLRYFVIAGRVGLIERLFGEVWIPRAVERELSHDSTPAVVRQWIQQRPAWLHIRDLGKPIDPLLSSELDAGEAEAIQLSLENRASLLIIDERRGRLIASRRGLVITGALGILVAAYRRKQFDNPLSMLDDLRTAGFRVSPRLITRFQELIADASAKRYSEDLLLE